jgi:hypothetical protein
MPRTAQDGARGVERRASPGQQLVGAADIGQPLPFTPSLVVESGRPGDSAIDRPENERRSRLPASAGDRARCGRCQGRHTVNHVEPARCDIRAEAPPDQALEIGVDQRRHRGRHRPPHGLAAAHRGGELGQWRRDHLGVDRREIPALDAPCAQEGVAVAHLGHDMDIGLGAQRIRDRPADERHAHPLGIRRLGDHQGADASHRHSPRNQRCASLGSFESRPQPDRVVMHIYSDGFGKDWLLSAGRGCATANWLEGDTPCAWR